MRKKHGSVPKLHTCSGLDSHNEQKHWHSKCHYKRNSGSTSAGTNNPTRWGGVPAEQQKTDERRAVARSSSGDDDDFCSGGPNSGNADLRVDAAARRPPPMPKLVRQGRAEGRRSWRSARGRSRPPRRRKNLFRLPWQTPTPQGAPKPLAAEDQARCSCRTPRAMPASPPITE